MGQPNATPRARKSFRRSSTGDRSAALADTDKQKAASDDKHEPGHGRNATKPSQVPPQGWLDILTRTKKQLGADNLTIVAAGIAFYGFVAVVPALAVTVAIYGLVADPAQVTDQITALAQVVADEVLPLLHDQMLRITSNHHA